MGNVAIIGLGAWSERFADWSALARGLRTGAWDRNAVLQPARIASRERRRAPKQVKMAIEVMSQACEMADLEPASVATVFSSAMGDMDITNYMCSALAMSPREISPTRFHNSVHNAPAGYWSIATGSHTPASAISAYRYTAPMSFLEAAIQAIEENVPVLVVTQETAAPVALKDTCPTDTDFSAAILLAPSDRSTTPVATVRFTLRSEAASWPHTPHDLANAYSDHPGAGLLPLLAAIAMPGAERVPVRLTFPVSAGSSIEVVLSTGAADG
ncbi:MAG: beta-ketoacyl synthase chain length factor [Woeseia sp.]